MLRRRLKNLAREVERKLDDHEVGKLLMSIEGLGPLTAACLIAELGDPARFDSSGAIASYVGVIPRIRQSGKKRFTKGSTIPLGNARLRKIALHGGSTSMDGSPVARRMGFLNWPDRLQTSIRRYQAGAPKWDIRSHSPQQMAGLEGHYKRQGLSVPVRSVSPFTDPSSNVLTFSRCGAVSFAAGQHGPDYPCVLIGDRHCCAVIPAPQAKFIDPHTPCIGFSYGCADHGAGAMHKQGS